jgi:hypothetical protein
MQAATIKRETRFKYPGERVPMGEYIARMKERDARRYAAMSDAMSDADRAFQRSYERAIDLLCDSD